jgi:hypothetical protein
MLLWETTVTVLRNVLVLTLPSLIALFVILEVFFRFVIPAAEHPSYYYDANDRIVNFSTTKQREGVFTFGPLAQQRASWRINNAGWNSAIDYMETKRKPRIAIIGDSYVEAMQVDIGKDLAGQLRALLSPDVEVYAFGIPGAPLSHYLQMARYVRAHFDPDIFVINVVHNDFAESLCSVKRTSGYLCLEDNGEDIREASITPYQPKLLFLVANQSSVIRYMAYNMRLLSDMTRLFSLITNRPAHNANIDVNVAKSLKRRIQKATDYVLSTMKRENNDIPTVFLMDAPRKDIYAGTMNESNVRWLNELLAEECEQFGFPFIDLTDEFTRSFRAEHIHFESKYDGHWNEKGHQVAALALHDRLRTLGVLENEQAKFNYAPRHL